jgi:hypothetical protein
VSYHTYYPFKTRIYTAQTTTTNTICGTVVIARGKLDSVWYATTPLQTQSAAANALDITVNGSTATGLGALTITTSTGNTASGPFFPTANVFLKAGDTLASVCSSLVGGQTTYIVREF